MCIHSTHDCILVPGACEPTLGTCENKFILYCSSYMTQLCGVYIFVSWGLVACNVHVHVEKYIWFAACKGPCQPIFYLPLLSSTTASCSLETPARVTWTLYWRLWSRHCAPPACTTWPPSTPAALTSSRSWLMC